MTPQELARFGLVKHLSKADKAKVAQVKTKQSESKLKAEVARQLAGLPKYETELKFHPSRAWRFDYAWPDSKVALEVHGGVFTDGRHNRGTGFTNDREKMNEAAIMGWIVIEATTEQVKNGMARGWLIQLFKEGNLWLTLYC